MTEPEGRGESTAEAIAESLRTPRAAAIAGLAFCVIMLTSWVLIRLAVPVGEIGSEVVSLDERQLTMLRVSTALVPFAGISFLWFIGVIRSQIGVHEDRLFATVFLGSSLIFVALLFVGTAAIVSIIVVSSEGVGIQADLQIYAGRFFQEVLTGYAARMAGVSVIAITTLGRRSRTMPKWLVVVGYAAGLGLLIAPFGVRFAELLFPLWAGVFSVYVFVRSSRHEKSLPTAPQ